MGTNYYLNRDLCGECGRYESIHIGKNLVMFRGYFDDERMDADVPTIASWQDWKRVFAEDNGIVVDEYGIEFTVAEFVERVEATDRKERRRQYDWVVGYNRETPAHPHKLGIARDGDWLDADGFSFTGGDFS